MILVECKHCGARVLPRSDGRCPNCQELLGDSPEIDPQDVPDESDVCNLNDSSPNTRDKTDVPSAKAGKTSRRLTRPKKFLLVLVVLALAAIAAITLFGLLRNEPETEHSSADEISIEGKMIATPGFGYCIETPEAFYFLSFKEAYDKVKLPLGITPIWELGKVYRVRGVKHTPKPKPTLFLGNKQNIYLMVSRIEPLSDRNE